jgi:hypothetical protein
MSKYNQKESKDKLWFISALGMVLLITGCTFINNPQTGKVKIQEVKIECSGLFKKTYEVYAQESTSYHSIHLSLPKDSDGDKLIKLISATMSFTNSYDYSLVINYKKNLFWNPMNGSSSLQIQSVEFSYKGGFMDEGTKKKMEDLQKESEEKGENN